MADCNHCRDFPRAQLLRESVVSAGAGLPSIEDGMPMPAGTGLSRRSFLARGTGLALSVYGASHLPLSVFEDGIAHAATGRTVLVSVFMAGGIDALNVLAPVTDNNYRAWRPTLAVGANEGTPYLANDAWHWHPVASSLGTLHKEGKVTVMPGIGYDHPNQSHFTSRHFWEIGELVTSGRVGWMGRLLDQIGDEFNPLQGIALSNTLYPSLASTRVPVAAVPSPSGYRFTAQGVSNPVTTPMFDALKNLGQVGNATGAMADARGAIGDSAAVREALLPFTTPTSTVTYPTGSNFPDRLKALAAMIAAGLPIRCIAINAAGGYDTHSGQRTAFETGLRITADSLLAFQRDLEARKVADRVLVHLWSEFGRRPQENGSQGTDHGTGGISLLIGSRASGTQIGDFPGLSSLDPSGNLRATSDFRAVYASLSEQWFGQDAATVIPGADRLPRYRLLK